MNRFGGRRSPEAWSSAHDRARARLAERMTELLEPAESAWLDAHLVDCAACREIDAAYRSDREGLRAMRVIPPPRDLWARTSAALDMEQARAGAGRRSRPARQRNGSTLLAFPRGRWAPVGALSSIAAVMVVGFLLGNAIIGTPTPSLGVALGGSATPNPVHTPIKVPSQGDVAWVSVATDGSIVVHQAPVDKVCPATDPAGCPPIDSDASGVVTLAVKPTSVHQSPTSGQMIVVGRSAGAGSGQTMYVIDTGKGAKPSSTPIIPTTPPSATPATSVPTPSPTPGGPSTSPGSGTPTPTTPTKQPTSSPTASIGTSQTTSSPTPAPTSTASIVPNVTPPPSAATLIAIATDVGVLNAETAAYSPDGAWFAFTARAQGVANGSDIYLWHAGDAQAKKITDDGRSVFAGWVRDRLVGSRAATPVSGATSFDASSVAPASGAASLAASVATSAGTGEFTTTSFLVNAATLARTSVPTAAWRPSVDPTGRFVVYWEGTVARDPLSGGWRTATGRLVIRAWPVVSAPAPVPSATPAAPSVSPSVEPRPSASTVAPAAPSTTPGAKATKAPPASPAAPSSASASAAASAAASASRAPSASPSASPTASAPAGLPDDIASAAGVDWSVAWDETGTHLAVWIGDREDRSFGRLDLLTIGPNGLPATGGALLRDRPALPGISLSDGHLVWASPPGVNGDGSQLKVFDYTGPDAGENAGQGQPGGDTVVVVQH